MSHKPRVPSASVSLYPLQPEPIRDYAPDEHIDARAEADAAPAIQASMVVKGAAIGIGSAAIVAALMYMRRR